MHRYGFCIYALKAKLGMCPIRHFRSLLWSFGRNRDAAGMEAQKVFWEEFFPEENFLLKKFKAEQKPEMWLPDASLLCTKCKRELFNMAFLPAITSSKPVTLCYECALEGSAAICRFSKKQLWTLCK